MAKNLFHDLSRANLKKEIDDWVQHEIRSLPKNAKIFAAIAHMQGFDTLPKIATPEEMEGHIASGGIELNRGISSNQGMPAANYAHDLLYGSLYPGTQVAHGQGIYCASPSEQCPHYGFPRVSRIAKRYAEKEPPGLIVRCALRQNAKHLEDYDLRELINENRGRARAVGLEDLGCFAAALGFSAYYRDHLDDLSAERIWVVLNRGDLICQEWVLQV